MSQYLHREIENIKNQLLELSSKVEENLNNAVKSVENRDEKLAGQVIAADIQIDDEEVMLEEDVLKILALHQPVANDLRFLIAVLKINNSLERINDLAVNIAEKAAFLAQKPKIDIPFDFTGMATYVKAMFENGIKALVTLDSDLARQVCADDDKVDAINREMYQQVKDGIRNNLDNLNCLIHLLGISRDLERIGDMATNIAEDVIYMISGDIVRHQAENYRDNAE